MFRKILILFLVFPMAALTPYWELHLRDNFTHSTPLLWRGKAVLVGTAGFFVLDLEKRTVSLHRRFPGTRLMGESLVHDLLVVPTLRGFLHCFDLKGAKPLWSLRRRDSFLAKALVDGGALYAGTARGILYKLSLETGRVLWRKRLSGPFYSAPVKMGKAVYIGNIRGDLYGLSSQGRVFCTFSRPWPGPLHISPRGDRLAFTMGKTLLFSDEDCKIKWKKVFGAPLVAPPAALKNSMVLAPGREVLLLDEGGRVRWRFKTRSRVVAKPLVKNSFIFVVDSSGFLYQLDFRGSLLKTAYAGGPSYSPPLVTRGFLLLLTLDGKVTVFKR